MQAKTINNPMYIFYNQISLLLSGKGNIVGFTALGVETTGFIFNPTVLNGLVPIVTGVGLWLVSLWQKRKAEERADELHAIELDAVKKEKAAKQQETELLLQIKEEELEGQRLRNQKLREEIGK